MTTLRGAPQVLTEAAQRPTITATARYTRSYAGGDAAGLGTGEYPIKYEWPASGDLLGGLWLLDNGAPTLQPAPLAAARFGLEDPAPEGVLIIAGSISYPTGNPIPFEVRRLPVETSAGVLDLRVQIDPPAWTTPQQLEDLKTAAQDAGAFAQAQGEAAQTAASVAAGAAAAAQDAVDNLGPAISEAATQAVGEVQSQISASLNAIAQTQQNVEAARVTLEAQTAQAVQQAASVSLMQQAVASEAALAGRPAGNYPVLDGTPRIVTWDGSAVTATGPELATMTTSVARVPDAASLSAYNGTALTVNMDDPVRGGAFIRALAGAYGAVDNGRTFPHANPAYVWLRRGAQTTIHADWYVGAETNHAPALQRAIDATPVNGTLILGRKRAPNGTTGYYYVAPWAGQHVRPDGTKALLRQTRPLTIIGDASEYGGFLAYDTALPDDTDVWEVTSSSAADAGGNPTYYRYRFQDLAIVPLTASPAARHILSFDVTATANIADCTITGGQFVATNPAGRAIRGLNNGNNGMFGLRIRDCRIDGGLDLDNLGDSCEIIGGFMYCTFNGALLCRVKMLSPQNPTDTAAQFVMERVNMNAKSQALKLIDSATFRLANLNVEGRNRHEGGAGHYGLPLVHLIRCGNVPGIPGQSALQYGGSVVDGVKILPADGATYDTSSGADALWLEECRNVTVRGGAFGASQVLGANDQPVSAGRAIRLFNACRDIVLDMPDIQLTTSAIGVDIEGDSRNTRVRGVTANVVGAGSTLVRDLGQGTMGVPRELTLGAGLEAVPGGDPLRAVKDETGMVHLSGMVRPAGGAGNISPYMLLATLPVGFRPAEIIRRGVDISQGSVVVDNPNQLLWRRMPLRVVGEGNGAASGRVDLSAYSNDPYDTTTPDVREMLIDCGWHAPLA